MSRLLSSVLLSNVLLVLSGQPLRTEEPAAQANALPAGALFRLGAPRFLNFGRVFSVAFSPEGTTVAAGSWDGTVRVWELASRRELHFFQEEKTRMRVVAFSPDGKILAYGGDDVGIVLREAATGKELHRLKGHRGPITVVAFSPDGKLLASKSYDRTLRLWDVAAGREVRRLGGTDVPREANDPACPVSFALDGKTVASATLLRGDAGLQQRTFRVWDVATGAEVRAFTDSASSPGIIAFSPDNRLLAVATGRRLGLPMRIRFWDVGTGRALAPIEVAQAEQSEDFFTLVFSPDGKTLASSLGGPMVLWEVATRQEVCRFPNTEPTSLAFSLEGRLLASSSIDVSVLLWDATGRGQNGKVQAPRLSPEEARGLWDDLGSQDVNKARRALWRLVDAGEDAVALLRARLQPVVSPASAETVARLVADLDSPQLAVRSRARARLVNLAEFAEPALLEAQKNRPSLEQRQRIDELLQILVDQRSRPSGDRLRTLRAVEILEQVATPAARQLLQALSRGAAGALLTCEAQAAVSRLERHAAPSQPGR
jgi:WD40 repeat protein